MEFGLFRLGPGHKVPSLPRQKWSLKSRDVHGKTDDGTFLVWHRKRSKVYKKNTLLALSEAARSFSSSSALRSAVVAGTGIKKLKPDWKNHAFPDICLWQRRRCAGDDHAKTQSVGK